MQNTFLKRWCIKLQNANDPDKVSPGKSYISIYRVKKLLSFPSCFLIWWKDIFCSITKCLRLKKKERQNIMTNPLGKLWWMELKNNEISAEDTFKYYNYLEEVRIPIKFCKKNTVKSCKLSYFNVSLVVVFGRFIGKNFQ